MTEITIDGIEYLLIPKKTQKLFNDWRLPTIQELNSLVNYETYDPACDLEDTRSEYYWTSSPYIQASRGIWVVNFKSGINNWNNNSSTFLVRCVRDGKDGLEWSKTSDNKMSHNDTCEYTKNLVAPVYYKAKK